MPRPASALAVDAAVLIVATRGRSSGALTEVARGATLVTTDRAAQEARRRFTLGLQCPELLHILDALIPPQQANLREQNVPGVSKI